MVEIKLKMLICSISFSYNVVFDGRNEDFDGKTVEK